MIYETERLVVRDLADDDAEALYDIHRRDGLGWFAMVEKESGRLVGVQVLRMFQDLPYVDLGWRLNPDHWGRGYATESARGAIAYGFGTLGLDEIAAATLPDNVRSRAVMERLGMTFAGDVMHAGLPHVLYLIRAAEAS